MTEKPSKAVVVENTSTWHSQSRQHPREERQRRRQRQYDREKAAAELLRCHAGQMSEANRKAVSRVAHYRKSLAQRLRLAADGRYTMGSLENDFWLKLRILIGKL